MKNKIYLNLILTFLFACLMAGTTFAQIFNAQYYKVKNGVGNGLRFWTDNHNDGRYSVTMGNTEAYKLGEIQDFSIKMSMNKDGKRGWTWGVLDEVPCTALNTEGNFQTQGWIKSMAGAYYFGNSQRLSGDGNTALYWKSNNGKRTQLILQDRQGSRYGSIYGSGDGVNFGLLT